MGEFHPPIVISSADNSKADAMTVANAFRNASVRFVSLLRLGVARLMHQMGGRLTLFVFSPFAYIRPGR